MTITITNTSKVVDLNGTPARIWEGQTESGTPVMCFVTRIAPTIPTDDPRQAEFFRELTETRAPSPAVEAIPLRLIL